MRNVEVLNNCFTLNSSQMKTLLKSKALSIEFHPRVFAIGVSMDSGSFQIVIGSILFEFNRNTVPAIFDKLFPFLIGMLLILNGVWMVTLGMPYVAGGSFLFGMLCLLLLR